MKTRAAIAFEAGKPLTIGTVELDGPKPGEVLVGVQEDVGSDLPWAAIQRPAYRSR